MLLYTEPFSRASNHYSSCVTDSSGHHDNFLDSFTELWEMHEIRYALHVQRQHRTLEEINQQALQKYAMWQQERECRQQNQSNERVSS
jgi:hypothetical protein